MRVSGFIAVAVVFVAVALLAYAVINAVGWDARDFALVAAAIVASQVGAIVWHYQAPATPERSVKLGLGVVVSATAVVFALVFQAISGWLTYPEVTVPIAAIGCFVFPFAVVGPVWKAFSKSRSANGTDTKPGAADDQAGGKSL
jgi:F0F1-type ATP synthase membrane subunit a